MFKAQHFPSKTIGPTAGLAQTNLWLPRAALASCVRAVIGRSTLGFDLSEAQRYNHFPATPACSIIWYFSGECSMLAPGCVAASESPRTPLPGQIVFSGPSNRPAISWNPGPMHAMTLLLLPDALSVLSGIDPGAYVNRKVPVDQVFDASWLAFFHAVADAADDEQRVARIESFLHPLWQQRRPEASLPVRLFEDWSQSLALRAANFGLGRSLRQAERRIKQWTGQPLRELRGVGRSERAFFAALAAMENGALNWTEVATAAGYADQSHLCRQTRRVTGFSPEELRRRIVSDESFWVYRLWGFSEADGAD